MTDAPWLTIAELADVLRVHERTLRRWIKAGEPAIEVLQIRGLVRVRRVPPNVRECPDASLELTPSGPHTRGTDSEAPQVGAVAAKEGFE